MRQNSLSKSKIVIIIVGVLSLSLIITVGLSLLLTYVIIPTLMFYAMVPREAQVREMERVEEEFLRAYPLEELGDNVSIRISPMPGDSSEYGIEITNVTNVAEQDKIIQVLEEITKEHVHATSTVTLSFVKTRFVEGDEFLYDIESARFVTLIDNRWW